MTYLLLRLPADYGCSYASCSTALHGVRKGEHYRWLQCFLTHWHLTRTSCSSTCPSRRPGPGCDRRSCSWALGSLAGCRAADFWVKFRAYSFGLVRCRQSNCPGKTRGRMLNYGKPTAVTAATLKASGHRSLFPVGCCTIPSQCKPGRPQERNASELRDCKIKLKSRKF